MAQHPVAFLGGVEQRLGDDLGSTVAKVLEDNGIDRHVARHPIPLEGPDHPLLRRHLAEAPSKAVHAVRAVLDESPVAAARHTRSRGASKMRSMWISRSVGVVTIDVCEVLPFVDLFMMLLSSSRGTPRAG